MMEEVLTRIRHGPLEGQEWLWQPLRRIRRSLEAVLPGSPVRKRIGGFGPFLLDRRFAYSDFARWGAGHNRAFRACIEAAQGRSCVIDVGAHIGLVTLPLSRAVAPGGTVWAFEPAERNRGYLDRHLVLNGIRNVRVVPWLLGPADAEDVEFHESEEDSGKNSIVAIRERGFRTTRKRQVTLDTFCREHGVRPQVIKIDTEGAEFGILQGARATLRVCRPQIFLSVHPRHLEANGQSAAQLHVLLGELGYEVRDVEGNAVAVLRKDEYCVLPVPAAEKEVEA